MLSPSALAYLIGPIALVIIIFLMKFNVLARESIWLWLAVFIASPLVSFVCNRLYLRAPTPSHLHIRIAAERGVGDHGHLSHRLGSGPGARLRVLGPGEHRGGRVARSGAPRPGGASSASPPVRSPIWQHWAPSFLSTSRANALALMGAVVLLFVIRMAGVVMEQKEKAETSMRLSEDRFRSLIQNSSDVTIVIDEEGRLSYVSPVVTQLLGFEPSELVGRRATEIVHADDHEYVTKRFASVPGTSADPSLLQQFRMQKKDGTFCNVEAVITDQRDRPSIGGYVANVRDITERKEFEALLAHQALHDSLTGLANRQLTVDRAEQMLLRARREQRRGGSVLHRPRQLQGHQRLARPRGGGQAPVRGGGAASRDAARRRHRGATRGGRVRDLDRGRLPGRRPAPGGRAHPRGPPRTLLLEGLRGPAHHGDRQRRHRHG